MVVLHVFALSHPRKAPGTRAYLKAVCCYASCYPAEFNGRPASARQAQACKQIILNVDFTAFPALPRQLLLALAGHNYFINAGQAPGRFDFCHHGSYFACKLVGSPSSPGVDRHEQVPPVFFAVANACKGSANKRPGKNFGHQGSPIPCSCGRRSGWRPVSRRRGNLLADSPAHHRPYQR